MADCLTTAETLAAVAGWCDATLHGIEWPQERSTQGGGVLVLRTSLPVPGDPVVWRRAVLRCTRVGGLIVELASAPREHWPPLTWDVSFDRTEDGRWRVLFDFASHGELRFECAEVQLSWAD